jgi:CheY-like chemotaxis protein
MDLNIYLVDDDQDDQDLFRESMKEIYPHAKLYPFANGVHLMQQLNGNEGLLPDLIIMDINMPQKNGKESLREIRNNPLFKHIPVIIFTTSMDERDVNETFTLGANLFVNKPSSFEDQLIIFRHIFLLYNNQQLFWRKQDRFVLPSAKILPRYGALGS